MNKDNIGYENVTVKMLEDIMQELAKKPKANKFLITGSCIERGMIQLDVINGGLCNNEKCGLCSGFQKAFKQLI